MFEKTRFACLHVCLACCMSCVFVFLAFRCDISFGFATRGKTGLWATVPVAGGGREQGATNIAFPSPLEGTIMGQGGRKGNYVAKKY